VLPPDYPEKARQRIKETLGLTSTSKLWAGRMTILAAKLPKNVRLHATKK